MENQQEEPLVNLDTVPQEDSIVGEAERPIREPYTELELLKTHNVSFRFADVGCTINVGCKTYCFNDNIVALEEFSKYVKNPSEAHKKWNN